MNHLLVSIRMTLVLVVVTCAIYPAMVWGIGQVAFREKADGSLVMRDGKVIGSSLIGQRFTSEQYFHSRPSAAGDGYDASASGGSNLGPTSKKLRERIAMKPFGVRWPQPPLSYATERGPLPPKAVAAATALQTVPRGIPVDAITTSASGLDPHVSPEFARLQIARVARSRGVTADDVEQLVAARTEGRFLGLYGEPRVNVLLLNLDLDRRQSTHRASLR